MSTEPTWGSKPVVESTHSTSMASEKIPSKTEAQTTQVATRLIFTETGIHGGLLPTRYAPLHRVAAFVTTEQRDLDVLVLDFETDNNDQAPGDGLSSDANSDTEDSSSSSTASPTLSTRSRISESAIEEDISEKHSPVSDTESSTKTTSNSPALQTEQETQFQVRILKERAFLVLHVLGVGFFSLLLMALWNALNPGLDPYIEPVLKHQAFKEIS